LRKFWIIASTCIFLFTTLAHAQQIDIAVGWSTLESPYKASDLVNFHPPLEKGGFFPNVSLDVVRFKHRLGFNVETAWRYKQASYYGYENYRPIFTDVNALFQPKLPRKFGLDITAGVGIASNLFDQLSPCNTPGCINFTSSNHFMEDFGAGFRYYFWHRLPHFFLRPEAHYYHVHNNQGFNSDNVFRVGASIGYTFGK
jgi:hypothetical protein